MKQYYALTPYAVMEIAIHLMEQNGTTTTLEVKQALREQGFWAIQADISVLMQQLALELGWDFFDTGRFRVYFMSFSFDTNGASSFGELNLN